MNKLTAFLKTCVVAAVAVGSLAAFAIDVAPAAATTGTLDQSYLSANTDAFIQSSQTLVETFTAGRTGPLTEVGLVLIKHGSPASAISVEILGLNAGVPDPSNVLGSATLTSGAVPSSLQELIVPLTVVPSVVSGQQYAIQLSATGAFPNSYGWGTVVGDGYAGGTGWNMSTGPSSLFFDFAFETYVGTVAAPAAAPPGPRGAYCTASGNTSDAGAPLAAGTFVNLDEGQASNDPHYAGATPASFVQGVGLTCAPAPAGYVRRGFATADMDVDANTYPYYAAA